MTNVKVETKSASIFCPSILFNPKFLLLLPNFGIGLLHSDVQSMTWM